MRAKDFIEEFPDTILKVVAEDTAWLRNDNFWQKSEELWKDPESADVSGLTEQIYLLSNR
jgi:hypothetical protein